jgi:hypothetical protein
VKIRAQQPNSWHLLVTLFAMVYLSGFTPGLGHGSFISPDFVSGILVQDMLILFVWCFLILDLVKQISLFFQKKKAK